MTELKASSSQPATGAAKRRAAECSARAEASLHLANKQLPHDISLTAASFLKHSDFKSLLFTSKSSRSLVLHYLWTAHSISLPAISKLQDDDPVMVVVARYCSQLKYLSLRPSDADANPQLKTRLMKWICSVVYRNAQTFEQLSCKSIDLYVLVTLLGCPNLTTFTACLDDDLVAKELRPFQMVKELPATFVANASRLQRLALDGHALRLVADVTANEVCPALAAMLSADFPQLTDLSLTAAPFASLALLTAARLPRLRKLEFFSYTEDTAVDPTDDAACLSTFAAQIARMPDLADIDLILFRALPATNIELCLPAATRLALGLDTVQRLKAPALTELSMSCESNRPDLTKALLGAPRLQSLRVFTLPIRVQGKIRLDEGALCESLRTGELQCARVLRSLDLGGVLISSGLLRCLGKLSQLRSLSAVVSRVLPADLLIGLRGMPLLEKLVLHLSDAPLHPDEDNGNGDAADTKDGKTATEPDVKEVVLARLATLRLKIEDQHSKELAAALRLIRLPAVREVDSEWLGLPIWALLAANPQIPALRVRDSFYPTMFLLNSGREGAPTRSEDLCELVGLRAVSYGGKEDEENEDEDEDNDRSSNLMRSTLVTFFSRQAPSTEVIELELTWPLGPTNVRPLLLTLRSDPVPKLRSVILRFQDEGKNGPTDEDLKALAELISVRKGLAGSAAAATAGSAGNADSSPGAQLPRVRFCLVNVPRSDELRLLCPADVSLHFHDTRSALQQLDRAQIDGSCCSDHTGKCEDE